MLPRLSWVNLFSGATPLSRVYSLMHAGQKIRKKWLGNFFNHGGKTTPPSFFSIPSFPYYGRYSFQSSISRNSTLPWCGCLGRCGLLSLLLLYISCKSLDFHGKAFNHVRIHIQQKKSFLFFCRICDKHEALSGTYWLHDLMYELSEAVKHLCLI